MRSPFPGMDPYLEYSELWPEFHSRMIVGIADAIALPLRPNYYVAVEKRTYMAEPDDSVLVGIPDVSVFSKQTTRPEGDESQTATAVLSPMAEPLTVIVPMMEEVQERYLEIRDVKTGVVITTLEMLSPTNKRPGKGRETYLQKRRQVLASLTHLVEIDLLRSGKSMPMQGYEGAKHYRILISRGEHRPKAQLYAFDLQDEIPIFPLTLRSGDVEPAVNLKQILAGVYERAGYDLRIDYSQAAQPALSQVDEAWVDQLLRELGVRS